MKGKNGKELHGAAKYTHRVYTIEGGPEKHDDIQQTKGVLKLIGLLTIARLIDYCCDKIEHMEIKAVKILKDEEEPPCS